MLDTFSMDTAGDFRQRYRHSYGYFTVPASGKKVLVYIQQVDEVVTFVDEHQAKYHAEPDEGLEFEFIPVRKKLFMFNGHLHLAQRRPARMWARGVNQQNTTMLMINNGPRDLSFGIVKAAFTTEQPNVLENLNALKQGAIRSLVLSDLFGVIGTALYLYDQPIGTFLTDTNEIVLEESLFKQEVSDLVERNNLGYRVSIRG